jgi:hypothetical protein
MVAGCKSGDLSEWRVVRWQVVRVVSCKVASCKVLSCMGNGHFLLTCQDSIT